MKLRTNLSVGTITVYGSQECPWTQKQLAYLDKKGENYAFVDCDQHTCPDFVDAFPTSNVDGKIVVGFKYL
jgi:hypothetical protein